MNNFTRGYGLLEGFLAKKRAKKADSFIQEKRRNGKILDIGCGSFPFFLFSTEFNEKYGIDPSLTSINVEGLNLGRFDITKDKFFFEDGFFDVITMLAVFEHIDKDKLNFVLKEIKRVLKNNGVFIITTPSPWSDKLLHIMGKFSLISSEEIHEHKTHYSKNAIEDIIEKAGFKKQFIKSGYFEFGMNMWFYIEK